jgi:hypothetical protein
VVSKEAVITGEIVREISSDTITKEEKKAEVEKPAANSQKNGSAKKKPNKKKVKGDSS